MTDFAISLNRATEIADIVRDDLQPYVHRIAIAGSVRRRKPHVKDIEDEWRARLALFEVDLAAELGYACYLPRERHERFAKMMESIN